MFRERSEDAQRSLRGNAYCFMLAFLGMCDPLRTLRGNPRVCLCSASLSLSLFDRAHTRAESARSSTVMYASDAHADLSTRPHTSHTPVGPDASASIETYSAVLRHVIRDSRGLGFDHLDHLTTSSYGESSSLDDDADRSGCCQTVELVGAAASDAAA